MAYVHVLNKNNRIMIFLLNFAKKTLQSLVSSDVELGAIYTFEK